MYSCNVLRVKLCFFASHAVRLLDPNPTILCHSDGLGEWAASCRGWCFLLRVSRQGIELNYAIAFFTTCNAMPQASLWQGAIAVVNELSATRLHRSFQSHVVKQIVSTCHRQDGSVPRTKSKQAKGWASKASRVADRSAWGRDTRSSAKMVECFLIVQSASHTLLSRWTHSFCWSASTQGQEA